jgi:hypothetical protein
VSMRVSGLELLKMLSSTENILIEIESYYSLNMNTLEDLRPALIILYRLTLVEKGAILLFAYLR